MVEASPQDVGARHHMDWALLRTGKPGSGLAHGASIFPWLGSLLEGKTRVSEVLRVWINILDWIGRKDNLDFRVQVFFLAFATLPFCFGTKPGKQIKC